MNGIRARIAGLVACADLTILEVDFVNPTSAPGHCPATSTFVHRVRGDRSATVDIYYHAVGSTVEGVGQAAW